MARTLIICPTHDHADALFMSIASVRAQRDTDWRMVVICDGSPERTFQILEQVAAHDPRITYERHRKGERFGEAYRDPIIRNAAEPFVCHLSDDDIWSADHLDAMTAMLQRADFAVEAPLCVFPNGATTWSLCNHGTARRQFIPPAGLNNVGYRREAYLRLEEGWTPAPADGPSDVFMWNKFLKGEDIHVACHSRPTVLKLPSKAGERKGYNPELRAAELGPWLARVNQPGTIASLLKNANLVELVCRTFAAHEVQHASDFADAMARSGLRIVDEDAAANIAVDGELMDAPMTLDQRRDAHLVYLTIKAGSEQATEADRRAFAKMASSHSIKTGTIVAVVKRRMPLIGERSERLLSELQEWTEAPLEPVRRNWPWPFSRARR